MVADLVYNIMSCKKGGFISIRHNDLRHLIANMLSKVCKDIEIEPKLTSLTSRVRQQNCKHNEWSKTWHESTWRLGKRATSIFRFKSFWPQHLPLSQQVVATVPCNKQTRKEHAMREFCKLNMAHLHNWFFQFMEVWGENAVHFILDYLIHCQRNIIYQNW